MVLPSVSGEVKDGSQAHRAGALGKSQVSC